MERIRETFERTVELAANKLWTYVCCQRGDEDAAKREYLDAHKREHFSIVEVKRYDTSSSSSDGLEQEISRIKFKKEEAEKKIGKYLNQ